MRPKAYEPFIGAITLIVSFKSLCINRLRTNMSQFNDYDKKNTHRYHSH